ncbi:DUF4345 domain-containing protein [Actinomadura livida]|uniref:DUF4345 domain-containing protein n=2 Tax=Actinomadura livida TaxID=79909 RepID=A0A7W7IKS7_9ACTN|nr:hypothetical protein [Actinomadura catellatispora]GGU26487.1 membrane protein [Actinomadura livida]
MGLYGLVAPAALIRPFGIAADSVAARTEVRAVYGGFGVAVGGALIWAAVTSGAARHGVLAAVGIALLGMAAGRLAARAAEGPLALYPLWFYFWVEAVGGGLLLMAAAM